MRHPLITSASLATAALLLLSGCSGGGPSGTLNPEDSPLMSVYNVLYGTSDDKESAEKSKKQEEIVAECMADQGFDYTPVDYNTSSISKDYEDAYKDQGSQEWAAKYGYGLNIDVIPSDEQDAIDDPNSEYVESLSEPQMTAYYTTLYGDQTYSEETLDENGDAITGESSSEYSWQDKGCQGKAAHEVFGSQQSDPTQDPEFKTVIEEMGNLAEKYENEDSIKNLNKQWSECMADAGFPDFQVKDDAQASVQEAQNAYWVDPESEGPTEAEIEELKDAEIKIAVADATCTEKTNYENILLQSQFDVEQKFVDKNKSVLDALVAKYGVSP